MLCCKKSPKSYRFLRFLIRYLSTPCNDFPKILDIEYIVHYLHKLYDTHHNNNTILHVWMNTCFDVFNSYKKVKQWVLKINRTIWIDSWTKFYVDLQSGYQLWGSHSGWSAIIRFPFKILRNLLHYYMASKKNVQAKSKSGLQYSFIFIIIIYNIMWSK